VKAFALTLLLVVAPACVSTPPAASPGVPGPRASGTDASAPTASGDGPVVFVENDYPGALADARAQHRLLFVDAWATWCHTCLSLRSYVFPDVALRPLAGRFVWLSLDTEREENAAIVSKLGVRVLPTLYVIEPTSEKAVLAWTGSLTAPELARLLEESAIAFERGGHGGTAAAALLRANRASAEGNLQVAIDAYREALDSAPPGWPSRAQAVDGLVMRLADARQLGACVVMGADEAPKMPPGTALADVLRTTIGCAEDLSRKTPERARLAELTALGERVALDGSQPILADDRSDLFDNVVGALRELGRKDDVRRIAHKWAAFLEDQAARAPTPAARAVFDAHRLLAYVAVGEPQLGVPMLEQSEQDFPEDYNPPARLAVAYLALRRYDDALVAVRRALGRAYGPRKLRLWSIEADIDEAKGDPAAARDALRAGLSFARTVPLTVGYTKLRDVLEERLAKLR
jgi:tetratricopeptide (TPR) repeat protein